MRLPGNHFPDNERPLPQMSQAYGNACEGKRKKPLCALVDTKREKLSAFQNRRAKEGAGVNKRDVQKYMKQQQRKASEPVNNAFAQALAGFKLDE